MRFHTKGKDGLRELALQVTGVWAAVTKDETDAIIRPAMQRRQRYGPFLRPVCLFLFAMELDKKALKELIERVDVWYDALFPGLIGNGPRGSKADRKGAKQ